MSRDFSRGAVAALALALTPLPSTALAEDTGKKVRAAGQTLGNKVDEVTEAASQRKERAVKAVEDATERAREATEDAKERGRETAESLQERAEEAKENAKAYASELTQSLGDKAGQIGADAQGLLSKTKLWFKDSVQGVRDTIRDSLHGAADWFDNQAKDAREGARKTHWDKLRTRYGLPDQRPTADVSAELKEHEERIARLRRARELAESVNDQASVARADGLAEREYARHRRTLKHLIELERRSKALAAGEELSHGGEE